MLTRQCIVYLPALLLVLVASCGEESAAERLHRLPLTETSNGKKGVGSADAPVRKKFFGVQFQQKGLEIADADMYLNAGKSFFSGDTVLPTDTVNLMMLVRGWQAKNAMARNKFSTVMKRPDGTVAFQSSDYKTVNSFNIDSVAPGTRVYFHDMDTTLPFYDCEFTVTDVGNGRSLSGAYRVI